MMIKIRLFICILLIFIIPFNAVRAVETKFDDMPGSVYLDGKYYSGILVSEETYDDITMKLLRLKYLQQSYNNLETAYQGNLERFSELITTFDTLKDEIRLNRVQSEGWFERNKGTLGLATGIVVGVGLTILIVYGVNEAR